MGDVLEYPEVLQEVRGCMNPGRLKLQSSSLIFKNNKTGKVDHFEASDVDKTHWLLRARGHCLKVILKSGTTQRFDGFKETDYEKLSEFVQKNYSTKLEKKDLSMKGWNWGIAKFVGNSLDFKVDGLTSFEIPLANISHSQTSKNEVTIEFHQNDDAAVSLMEMRFHIPSSTTSDTDPVAEFYTNVMAKADVIQATGDAITTFTEIPCLTPRGRYDIKIFPTFLQLHGKTFDYKIPYMTILRLFLLPHRDSRQMYFIMSLDPPIKQGQTRYHFLILLFNKEEETTLELALTEDELEKKYEGKLAKEMSGPEYEVISRLMKVLVNKKITVPGSFIGHSGTNSISCSYKAATGALYPLERGFIFVPKPPVHIRFDEIVSVNFARSAGNTRSFDFDIETNMSTMYTFVGIEKDEYGKLYDFVTLKKLRVKNTNKDTKASYANYDDMLGSDDEDARDPYMEKMKKEGKKMGDDGDAGDDDEDDQDDEDFKPEGSASEPDDEYDSNLESTSEEDEDGEGGEGRKKERKRKKETQSSGSDEVEEEEDEDDSEGDTKKKHKKSDNKKKRTKKDDDPDKPKRPMSAYFLWLGESRAELKKEFPGLSMIEITKKAGEKWKEVTDKSKWESMAAELKTEYDVAMEEWRKNPKKESQEGTSSKSVKKPKESKPSSAGSGSAGFKSKEFVSDGESSAVDSNDEEDEDDRPLAPKSKSVDSEKTKKKKKEEESEEEEEEEEKPKRRKSRRGGGGSGEESEVGELPDEEEILSSPEHSAPEESDAESN